MNEGVVKSKKGNKGLIISLIVLVLIIIGLVVGIILIPKNSQPRDRSEITPEEFDENMDIIEKIQDQVNSTESEDEALALFDKKLEEYKGKSVWMNVYYEKVKYYSDIGQLDNAIKMLDDLLNSGNLTDPEIIELYSTYEDIYEHNGQNEKAKEFRDKYWELYLEYFNGGAGGE